MKNNARVVLPLILLPTLSSSEGIDDFNVLAPQYRPLYPFIVLKPDELHQNIWIPHGKIRLFPVPGATLARLPLLKLLAAMVLGP